DSVAQHFTTQVAPAFNLLAARLTVPAGPWPGHLWRQSSQGLRSQHAGVVPSRPHAVPAPLLRGPGGDPRFLEGPGRRHVPRTPFMYGADGQIGVRARL